MNSKQEQAQRLLARFFETLEVVQWPDGQAGIVILPQSRAFAVQEAQNGLVLLTNLLVEVVAEARHDLYQQEKTQ